MMTADDTVELGEGMTMMTAAARPLTLEQVADRYQVAPRTVQRWIEQQQFPQPAIRNGRTARWTLAQLLDYEARRAGLQLQFRSPGVPHIR